MNESDEMFEELNKWVDLLQRCQNLAIEMESNEQDVDYLNNQIAQLLDVPEDDYNLTFHDHRSPLKMKLHIEWVIVPFDETEDTI